MVKRATPLVLVLALLLGGPGAAERAWSGPNPDFKLVLHLVPVPEKPRSFSCFSHLPESPQEVVTAGDLYPAHYFVYVLVTDFSPKHGVAGVQFGISYNDSLKEGVDMVGIGWNTCTLYEWPMEGWPGANTGNLLTWNQAEDCQEKSPTPVGFFYVTAYSEDRLKIIPRPVDGLARVAVCGITTLNAADMVDNAKPEAMGWVDFGGGDGYNPWDPKQNLKNLKDRFRPIKD